MHILKLALSLSISLLLRLVIGLNPKLIKVREKTDTDFNGLWNSPININPCGKDLRYRFAKLVRNLKMQARYLTQWKINDRHLAWLGFFVLFFLMPLGASVHL